MTETATIERVEPYSEELHRGNLLITKTLTPSGHPVTYIRNLTAYEVAMWMRQDAAIAGAGP